MIDSFGTNFDKWQIRDDDSVTPSDDSILCLGKRKLDFEFYPVEIKSRILRYNEANDREQRSGQHEHWITFQDEITVVLDNLDEAFGLGREDNVPTDRLDLPRLGRLSRDHFLAP